MVIRDNFNIELKDNTVIALGSFDGLHLGHLALINKTIELAKKSKAKSMVNTFVNHPISVIDSVNTPKLIMSNDTKAEVLEEIGIDIVNFMEFNEVFMNMEPKDYILNIIKHYKAVGFVVGFNHRFGSKNKGNIELLRQLKSEYGFELEVIEPVTYAEETISSTRIRREISKGNLNCVNKMLFKPFMLRGRITEGKKIGRTIGFPTANLEYDIRFVLPSAGVYYTGVKYNGKLYKGITSIGNNPTIEGVNKLTIETYILDFNENIYNKNIDLYFFIKMRDMIKFDSLKQLIEQLNKDKRFAIEQNIEI